MLPEVAYAATLEEAAEDAEVVLLLTEWDEFRSLDPKTFAALVTTPRILDGRNCLDPQAWRDAGWEYRSMGRP
jgi:UDPglucose 6-dehydrogenase